MDESKSPTKLGKLPQPRGAKPLSKEKSNKDAHTQREETTTRRQGNLKLVKEEHSTGSSGAGKMRGRTSRLTRLTGRTTFGESGKGKAASSHQQQVTETPDSQGSYSTDSSPSTNRESSSPVVPGMTESSGAGGWLTLAWLNGAVLLSAGLKSGPLVCRSVEEGAEETPEVEEGSIAEQQLGLRQAEERLYRDYIHRLLKVKTGAKALRRVYRFTHACLSSIRSHSLFPSCLCSRPQSIPTTSIYASSVLCTSRTSKEHTSTSRRRDTRKTSRLGGLRSPPVEFCSFSGCVYLKAFLHQEKQEENELRALPPASAAHLRALDISIQRTARQNGISQEDFQLRKAVVTRMEELIRRYLPGVAACSVKEVLVILTLTPGSRVFDQMLPFLCEACSLRLYGSTLTQFAFRTSDINADISHPPSVSLLLLRKPASSS